MSLRLDCLFGEFKQNIRGPQLPLAFAGQPLGFFIARASRGLNGAAGIQLRTAAAYSPAAVRPAATVTDLVNLQTSLALMLQNPGGGQRISRVGVLYADEFLGHPNLFGLMFDRGFLEPRVPGIFSAVPREGCAVFLGAIARNRPHPQSFAMETLFTTAHEISHLFNLWHVDQVSFVSRSDVGSPPFGAHAYRYAAEHVAYLRQMDRPEVFPGGTPFGVRGLLGPPDDDPRNERRSSAVDITISTNVAEFWSFEPAELTVRISPSPRRTSTRPVRVADRIDPGYEEFDLWITEPDGVRRRYRPPALYCVNTGVLEVAPGKPFTRDIPIFGQAGGYTFRKAGLHQLLVIMQIGEGRVVRSNVLEVLVKEARPHSVEYERLRGALASPSTARLLFYKPAPRSMRVIDRALANMSAVRNPCARAAVRYASAVALAKLPTFRRRSSAATRRRALSLMKSALDSGRLGQHQNRKAAKCVEEFTE